MAPAKDREKWILKSSVPGSLNRSAASLKIQKSNAMQGPGKTLLRQFKQATLQIPTEKTI